VKRMIPIFGATRQVSLKAFSTIRLRLLNLGARVVETASNGHESLPEDSFITLKCGCGLKHARFCL
jgi:hypothetical protein